VSNECKCLELKKLDGPLNPSGKDYYCIVCGREYRAELLAVVVKYGKPPSSKP